MNKAVKTHWKKTFNKDHLGAWDIDEGEELKLVVKHVIAKEITNVGGIKDFCNVAYFTDDKIKPMILNVGNCKIMQRFSGSKFIQDWVNIRIQVYVLDGVRFGNDITEGLRLRENQPRMEQDKEELAPDHRRWAEAVKKYAETKDLSTAKKYYILSKSNEEELIREAGLL